MGFTLIELLVVITVIAILAGLVAPMVFSHVGDAKASAARAQKAKQTANTAVGMIKTDRKIDSNKTP